MKATLVVLALVIGGFGGAYHFYLSPEARHERAALRLIRVLRMDELEYASFMTVYKRSREQGRINDAQYRCIVDVTVSDLAKAQVPGVKAYLDRAELESASAYFESPLGQKLLRYLFIEMGRKDPEFPLKVAGESPAFDIDEMQAIARFKRTPAGSKVWDVASVAEQTGSDIVQFVRSRKTACVK